MKTRIKSQLKNKNGFTLSETLIAVAIVVILLAVSFIGINALIDRINQTKLDNIAQSMYVSAQNRIRDLKASGEISRLLDATEELGAVADKPADWEYDADDTVEYGDLKYFYHDKDDPANSTPSDFVDFFFPKGSIDDNLLDDNWVIELDPVTGYVYSAFYSETRSADDYYISNIETLDKTGTPSIRFKDFRDSIKGKNKIGYYGGKANMPADANGNIIQASMDIINADILKTNMTAVLPSVFDTSELVFKLTVKGKSSDNTVTLTPEVSDENDGTARVFSASVILDKLEAEKTFKETFGDATWQPPDYVESRTGALIPGEDLELSFTVSSSDNSVPDSGPIVRTVNSLFASLNPTDASEANIAYGRHLQNLDTTTSGLPESLITSAKQISDIDFNDESDKSQGVEPFLWKTLYEDKTFTPINNPNLNTYSGYIPATESDSYKILNMHIAGNYGSAGLFGTFAGSEISGVTMVNEKIDGGTNVGGLVGTTTSDLIIKDCRLYVEKDRFVTGTTYIDNILFKGTSNVGGLVGSSESPTASNITIKDSFASTIIVGTGSVGGLIGSKTNGNAQIQDSYADSYLIIGIGGDSTSKIGGLAGGLTEGSSITGSYSAGFGISLTGDKIDSAAGFVPNRISSVTNSYSIFNCSESKATDVYSTALSATTVSNVYYFGSGEKKLNGSLEYTFTSNAGAVAGFPGSKFSSDNNLNDTYPYNQKTGLNLFTYPYLSITDLPHYGDWEKPEDKLAFGKAGLLYWEYVTGGSSEGYKVYMVGRKGNEAVYHDTTNTAHDDGGTVSEYGYGYYVAIKYKDKLKTDWKYVNKSGTYPIDPNASAVSYFNNNEDYEGYEFYCYTTCDRDNPATSYDDNPDKYIYMTANVQNATATLKFKGEPEPELSYSFCPFFAKSIKLTGWEGFDWNYAGAKPLLEYDPGTVNNPYRIRSFDQLQFINWNSGYMDCSRPVKGDNYMNFPYLHATKKGSHIGYREYFDGWTYKKNALALGEENWYDFEQSRENQNFIQDFDIECSGRTGFSPIAALGETTGAQADSFRLPLFAWFGGSFDGQSYKIKNLSIESGYHSVGVFGVTVSSTIKNVVLIGDLIDNPPVIKRPAESPGGFYAIGTLVGIANEYSTGKHIPDLYPNNSTGAYEGIIVNCAVAGYEVIDESTNPVAPGETAIGGLAGVLRTNIDRCSAVNTIKINTRNDRGALSSYIFGGYGDYISVGGIAGRNQTFINNCYSGGEVIVDPSLTRPEIFISGIATSAITPRFVNTSDSDARLFRTPQYNNCYSYMKLPKPSSNITVGTIASNANFMSDGVTSVYCIGGIISNCYHYGNYYKTGHELYPVEKVAWQNIWVGESFERTYEAMSQDQFCTDLNGAAPTPPYQKVAPSNYSFPCGDATLKGKDYPFAAVITQEHKNNPSDSDGIKYVHYGEWPGTGNLILKHHDGTQDYTDYSYTYHNGETGIQSLTSQETGKLYSDLAGEMSTKGLDLNATSIFEGWYIDIGGVRTKLLNADGSIFIDEGDIEGYTEDGKFNVNPVRDIELYAMWRISYNPLKFVTAEKPPVNKKYLVIAKVPRGTGPDGNPEYDYYCMAGGTSLDSASQVVSKEADLLTIDSLTGDYCLAWPVVDNETMLWEVIVQKNERYFKLFNSSDYTYLLNPPHNSDTDVVLDLHKKNNSIVAIAKPQYNSGTHNLFFQSNWRILFDDTDKKFIFEKSNQGVIGDPNQDGGIWLFECNTAELKETLYEFK